MSNPPRRILIVDDNHDYTDSLQMLLEMEGHDVQVAYDGPTAIEIAKQFHPEIVLLDLALPKMNGYDIAVALRALQAGQKEGMPLRLVAVSGYGQVKDRAQTNAAGFHAHLLKPAELSSILEMC